MAWRLPRLLRRIRPRVGHYQHSLPLLPVGRPDLRGYVERPGLADLCRGAACLVMPSRYEGFSEPTTTAPSFAPPALRGRLSSAGPRRRSGPDVYRKLAVSVAAAAVVVYEPVPQLSRCPESLILQVQKLVVADNLGRTVVQGVPVLQNERPAGFAANANRGIAETSSLRHRL
jgi:hypothetical protein